MAGDGGRFQAFLDLQARLSRYSAVNALLAFAQNPAASRLGDFDCWKRQNCSVRPGQTAISILEPHEYTKDDGTPGTGYNVKKVFDISQVDTSRLKNTPPPRHVPITHVDTGEWTVGAKRRLLGALASKAPVKITGVDGLPDGLDVMYDPQTESISVRRGMEFADTFRAVAQGLAYADLTTGADTQADPHFSAYCASYLLCRQYGVDTQGFSFASAPGLLAGMDAQEVKDGLSQIRSAAENISGRIARQLAAQGKAARNDSAK
ncbi:MAG: hypothetical protein LBQ15_02885 [Clostridium sp.]|nr:hypothetical protein [Clostridium sp.]